MIVASVKRALSKDSAINETRDNNIYTGSHPSILRSFEFLALRSNDSDADEIEIGDKFVNVI